jgi:cyclopropane-fatty-acyl-phospholipid synthase
MAAAHTASSAWVLRLLDRGLLPDRVIRAGIRRNLRARLAQQRASSPAEARERLRQFVRDRSQGPIAMQTATANQQHYEVPTEFYQHVLGRHMKYSSAFWDRGVLSLDDAEVRMLELTARRADLSDGQRVLELGCGWGSLSLWMARAFPRSEIVGVSNSRTQKMWIDAEAARRGHTNLRILTCDMNTFEAPGLFDRVVSVEMFEHMRNWKALLDRVGRWLRDDGRLFIHIFTHREYAYPYDVADDSDWMARYFFSGGIMPGDGLLHEFNDIFTMDGHWRVSGVHYQKTAEAWLANMDRHRAELWPILERTYGARDARRWWVRWRVFFMACAELWGWQGGSEWLVSHYLLRKTGL